jgi:hypothetical protein
MFALLRFLLLALLTAYLFCWWQSKRSDDPKWRTGRRLFARSGALLVAWIVGTLVLGRLL